MRLRQSKITKVVDGKHCSIFKLVIVYCSQERQFKIQWLNYGLFFILSCQSFSTIMNNSKIGSRKTSSSIQWIRESSTNINWSGSIWSYNLLCLEGWKRMLSRRLPQKLKRPSHAKWLIGKRCFMIVSSVRFRCKIYFKLLKRRQKWKIWWIWLCNSGRFVIILTCSNEGLERFHSYLVKWIMECSQI